MARSNNHSGSMTKRRSRVSAVTTSPAANWQFWVKTFGVMGIGFIGILVTFYFTTTATLTEHAKQFEEVGKKFDQFNTTMKQNYEDYAKNQKEEAASRDKMREQFMGLFNTLTTSVATTRVQVETTGKQLETVINKIDQIQNTQQHNLGKQSR